jgi:hypothetical protein
MLTRLGETGADAFTIMRIAGQRGVTVAQRYVHPAPEGMDRAFDRLGILNAEKFEQIESEAKAEATGSQIPAISPIVQKLRAAKLLQAVEIESTGP